MHKYIQRLSGLLENLETTNKKGKATNTDAALNSCIKAILSCAASKGKVIFIGNGGSASIASHQAVDFWRNGKIKAISFNDASLLTCLSNDFGYEYVFQKSIRMFAEKKDVLIAISSSGKSKNIINAVKEARRIGCGIITLSGFSKANPLRKLGWVNFYINSNSYGLVEISHLAICHYILDTIIKQK